MPESCFVLIHCDTEMRRSVVDQLKQIHNIDGIEELDNEAELCVKVIAESKDHLREVIAMKIQKMTCVNFVKNLGTDENK